MRDCVCRKWSRRVTVALFAGVLGTWAVGSEASAQVAEKPIAFAEAGAISIGTAVVPAIVVNNTSREWSLTAVAQLHTVDGAQVVEVRISPNPAALPPMGEVFISVGPIKGVSDAMSGFLVVTGTSGAETVVLRRPMVLGTSAIPAVSKWSGTTYAVAPFADASYDSLPTLPLQGTECPVIARGSVALTTGGSVTTLAYQCTKVDGHTELRFTTGDIPRRGSYSGTLKLGDTSVEMNLRATTIVLWPLLMIFVGLALALGQLAWVKNRRPINLAKKALKKDVANRAASQQSMFAANASGTTWQAYDFTAGILAEVEALKVRLDELPPASRRGKLGRWLPYPLKEQQDRYDAILSEAAALKDTVDHWPLLATTPFSNLNAAWLAIPTNKKAINLADDAGKLLLEAGSSSPMPLSSEQASELLDLVPRTTKALSLLVVGAEVEATIRALSTQTPTDAFDKAAYDRARQDSALANAELLRAKNAKDVEAAGVEELLESARRELSKLPPGRRIGPTSFSLPPPDVETAPSSPPWTETATAIARRIAVADLAIFVLAGLAALWTGLGALYLGKPWGRWGDYIAMVAWAFGIAAVSSLFIESLERLAGGDVQLNKAKTGMDKSSASM